MPIYCKNSKHSTIKNLSFRIPKPIYFHARSNSEYNFNRNYSFIQIKTPIICQICITWYRAQKSPFEPQTRMDLLWKIQFFKLKHAFLFPLPCSNCNPFREMQFWNVQCLRRSKKFPLGHFFKLWNLTLSWEMYDISRAFVKSTHVWPSPCAGT